jgi:hypothetical protein
MRRRPALRTSERVRSSHDGVNSNAVFGIARSIGSQ